jgi:anti-sigma factor RsiW
VSCPGMHEQLHAYVDGELDVVHTLEMEQHLQSCPACTRACGQIRELSTALRAGLPRHPLPMNLRRRVRASLRRGRYPLLARRAIGWTAVAASLAVLALGVWGLGWTRSGGTGHERLVAEVIASHVRSQMLSSHLYDVESTDQHTIKPWFHGKLDFAPTVTDLSKDGFVLAGGRLDYVNGRPVAALVYRRRKHVINLLTWPAKSGEPDASMTSETKQGYHVVHWRNEGMEWWAVSDLNLGELTEFAYRLQGRE